VDLNTAHGAIREQLIYGAAVLDFEILNRKA
jgi:hypothetical protein